jgi:hypothetical protein
MRNIANINPYAEKSKKDRKMDRKKSKGGEFLKRKDKHKVMGRIQ